MGQKCAIVASTERLGQRVLVGYRQIWPGTQVGIWKLRQLRASEEWTAALNSLIDLAALGAQQATNIAELIRNVDLSTYELFWL